VSESNKPAAQMVIGHFIVSDDVERSRRFYTEVLGGRVVFAPEPTNVALANSFIIIINGGGAPTDDKPTVTLETPNDPDRVSSFLNIRVADIQSVYAEWSARGAQFLTLPNQRAYEIRCYIRGPDGYIIEVGQTTDPQGDWYAGRLAIDQRRPIRVKFAAIDMDVSTAGGSDCRASVSFAARRSGG
jgi:catechol 2,3-dioxygenase-like lactoylglutathione lyase family enzyme